MVLARFPTLAGLVNTPPMLHSGFSLASSASCEAFTEQQTSFLEPGPCSTQARSSLGKRAQHREAILGEQLGRSREMYPGLAAPNRWKLMGGE